MAISLKITIEHGIIDMGIEGSGSQQELYILLGVLETVKNKINREMDDMESIFVRWNKDEKNSDV